MKKSSALKRLKSFLLHRILKQPIPRRLWELPEDLYQAHVILWGVPNNYILWLYDMNYHNDSVSSWFPQFHFGSETHWYKQI
ncbi:MAG: hypothetical protein V3U54_13325 [Thermodesulfobacteriota bacterium]